MTPNNHDNEHDATTRNIKSDIATCETILERLPVGEVLERMTFEHRLEQLREELAAHLTTPIQIIHPHETPGDTYTLADYQRDATRTVPEDTQDALVMGVLGMAGEAGEVLQGFMLSVGMSFKVSEVVERTKKHRHHAQPLDRDALTKELGDVLWYLASIAHALDIPLSVVARTNIAKLCARYPEGFTTQAAEARTDERNDC